MKQKITKFLVSILVCELAGVLGAFFTTPAIPNWDAGFKSPF